MGTDSWFAVIAFTPGILEAWTGILGMASEAQELKLWLPDTRALKLMSRQRAINLDYTQSFTMKSTLIITNFFILI
jgi:hypothetical protein